MATSLLAKLALPGYGKDLSVYGFEDYTRIKHVMHNIEF